MLLRSSLLFLLFLSFSTHFVLGQTPKPLQLHPDNPHYFNFRGEPTILITSAEHYGAVLNLDFDYQVYLNELARHRLNYTRIFTGSYVEMPGAFDIANNTLAPKPGRFLAPWRRSSAPGYFNGGNKFDLNSWDEAYFSRLKDFVGEAGKRGIVVEVTLFSSLYGDNGWLASPLHPNNNINGVNAIARQKVQTLDNGNLLRHQENLVRKILQELNGFDNIFFEIQNEPWADNGELVGSVNAGIIKPQDWQTKVETANAASLAWQKHLAQLIRTTEASLPNQHLVAQNISNFQHPIQNPDPNISIFNFHYALPAAVTLNKKLNKVIGFDESGFSGSADSTYRRQAWKFILAGGGLFNNLDYSFSADKENGTEVQNAPGGGSPAFRNQLKILKDFIYGLNFIRMQPTENLIKAPNGRTVQVLALSGEQYAAYLAGGNVTSLQLDLPKSKYQVTWLNPATGITNTTNIKSKGKTINLKLPNYEEDLAFKLVKNSSTKKIK